MGTYVTASTTLSLKVRSPVERRPVLNCSSSYIFGRIGRCRSWQSGTKNQNILDAGPIRFPSFYVSAHVTVLMSSRSTYRHTVLQYDSNTLRAS